MKIKCDYCGKTFSRKTCKSEFERYKHHFCSPECLAEWRKTRIRRTNGVSVQYQKLLGFADAMQQKKQLEKIFVSQEIRNVDH